MLSDITQRKKDRRLASEERYRRLVKLSDAILLIDKNRNIVSVNQAFFDLTGYTRGA
jgi:PAS domain S-box-containing protein